MTTVPPTYDEWTIYQGGLFNEQYENYDNDGDLVDMSSATIGLKIKSLDLASTHLSLTATPNGNGSSITANSSGVITIDITPADTTTLDFDTDNGHAVMEIELVWSATNVEKVLIGDAELVKE